MRMTIDELLRWKAENQHSLTEFLHQHRELSGMHYMDGAGEGAHIEFSLKYDMDDEDRDELSDEIEEAFPGIDFQFAVVDPDMFKKN
jgi:hypothetical protein